MRVTGPGRTAHSLRSAPAWRTWCMNLDFHIAFQVVPVSSPHLQHLAFLKWACFWAPLQVRCVNEQPLPLPKTMLPPGPLLLCPCECASHSLIISCFREVPGRRKSYLLHSTRCAHLQRNHPLTRRLTRRTCDYRFSSYLLPISPPKIE